MNESCEIVVADAPFTVRRRVRWSDCDPAGVAFTGRFTDYLLGAVDHFIRHILHEPRAAFMARLGIETPCKGMSLNFHLALPPEAQVDIVLWVARIGTHSFDLDATARLPDGRIAFEGRFSPICIQTQPRHKVPIPPALRELLALHTGS